MTVSSGCDPVLLPCGKLTELWEITISNMKINYKPSGKHTKHDGKSQFLMGKYTISMVIFNSYAKLAEGTIDHT